MQAHGPGLTWARDAANARCKSGQYGGKQMVREMGQGTNKYGYNELMSYELVSYSMQDSKGDGSAPGREGARVRRLMHGRLRRTWPGRRARPDGANGDKLNATAMQHAKGWQWGRGQR